MSESKNKIQFTKSQYELLLKLAYLGNWIVNSNRSPEEEETAYKDLAQFLYSSAKEFGLENLVTGEGKFISPSDELEENAELNCFIDDYNENCFWDELSDRLASRDAIRKCGEVAFEEMDPTEKFNLVSAFEEGYQEYFDTHGLEKVNCAGKSNR
jgi:hypothetical protein